MSSKIEVRTCANPLCGVKFRRLKEIKATYCTVKCRSIGRNPKPDNTPPRHYRYEGYVIENGVLNRVITKYQSPKSKKIAWYMHDEFPQVITASMPYQ